MGLVRTRSECGHGIRVSLANHGALADHLAKAQSERGHSIPRGKRGAAGMAEDGTAALLATLRVPVRQVEWASRVPDLGQHGATLLQGASLGATGLRCFAGLGLRYPVAGWMAFAVRWPL